MAESNEPRALAAALSGPAFMPRARVFDVADRHVERWAPEATADRVRPLRNLGFADRVVSPLMETAQRSVSQLQRLFSPSPAVAAEAEVGARASGLGSAGPVGLSSSAQPDHVSWLFPRPSFQDELDWMAAARQPVRDQHNPLALPVSLHDYIAPSLSPNAAKTPVRAPFLRSLAGTPFENSLGPRLVMPVGLGGLVAMVNQSLATGGAAGMRAGALGLGGLGGFVGPGGWRAPTLAVPTLSALIPSMTLIATVAHQFGKPRGKASALAAAEASVPAAIQHVAWSDRWLARFSGAESASLDALTTNRSVAAPELVLMAPRAEATAAKIAKRVQQAATIRRYDDNETTPDDVLTEIVTSAAPHIASGAPRARRPAAAMVRRDSIADVIAHAAPIAPDAGLSAQLASSPFAPAVRHVLPLAAAPVFDVRSLDGSNLSVAYLTGVLAPTTALIAAGAAADARRTQLVREPLDWTPTLVQTAVAAPSGAEATEHREWHEFVPMTARSALLAPAVSATGERRSVADAFASAITMPMLNDSLGDAVGSAGVLGTSAVQQRIAMFAAPGMIAGSAHAWSVAHERATSELALDFVPPELVLAARVYGLGPAEAGQAMRLAMAGPGQLVAMANAVDRTFVQVLEMEAERRDSVRRTTAGTAAAVKPIEVDDGAADTASSAAGAAFGIERRPPRGAFMWPAAAVAALGLAAAPPDGEQAMSVAALELLAASAVAQLGTYAVLGRSRRPELALSSGTDVAQAPSAHGAVSATGEAVADPFARMSEPPKQRAAFEAMYVALAKSAAERQEAGSWSPAGDAARAVALAGRGGEARTATERAQAAWGVLPLLAMRPEGSERGAGARAGERGRAQRGAGTAEVRADRAVSSMPVVGRAGELGPPSFEFYAPPAPVESRPGLAELSARAGEAITSYVTPVVVAAAPSADAEARAAAAAAEIMRPGRSAGRFGGGETQIPTWFEAAARKIFAERSGAGEGLSLAELTLVNAAPAQQIAAADQTEAAPTPTPAAPAAQAEFTPDKIKDLADQVLTIVKRMIEAAKDRGGYYV